MAINYGSIETKISQFELKQRKRIHRYMPAEDRFHSSYEVNESNGHWYWLKATNNGIPQMMVDHERKSARVFSLELAGIPVPPGKVVKPNCGIQECVSPEHLIVVDKYVSVSDTTHLSEINKKKITELWHQGKIDVLGLATMFRVTERTVRAIVDKEMRLNRVTPGVDFEANIKKAHAKEDEKNTSYHRMTDERIRRTKEVLLSLKIAKMDLQKVTEICGTQWSQVQELLRDDPEFEHMLWRAGRHKL